MAKVVMFVDKYETNRWLMAEDFRALGCEVIEASNIEELITNYPQDPNMVIIRERNLIYELIERARKAYNAPIIAIGSDQCQEKGCRNCGADGFYKMSEVDGGWAKKLCDEYLAPKESDMYVGKA